MYVLFTVPLAFGLLGLSVPMWKRVGFVIGLAAAIVCLMVNTQRATIVILPVVLPVILLLARRRRAVATTIVALAVAATGSIVGSRVAGQAFSDRRCRLPAT